ncbi:hypothetical protein SK571_03865 [Lentzea sp. BCCO 10_0798]|uniref:Uncharacterized protein n=1 Tax=Lentzea kristufekii TaxID=3095430 RepID=A0ABU4TKR1_9PSEU|nr:hypothetical protein [Lentzea sp. BCCO 10_0798]MDX8048507.1 hypothetical protein [Lentzea sp. BCCO 10_0798]
MNDNTMHIEKSRSLWNGRSTTFCGLTIPKPEKVWFPSLSGRPTCAACVANGGK